ncbi:hypothetical protein AB0H81_38060, partial [Nonomuraea sp. NPDC050691]
PSFPVSRGSARSTQPVALPSGADATPVLGRHGPGPHRRAAILATLAVVVAGSALTVLPLPLPFAWLLAGRAAQGVGLALTALLAELGGVRAAYGLGLVVTAAALLRSSPRAPAPATSSPTTAPTPPRRWPASAPWRSRR